MPAGENLLNAIIAVKYQAPIRQWICPVCGEVTYLMETERGLHCRFDGWNENKMPPKFIPRTPDQTTQNG